MVVRPARANRPMSPRTASVAVLTLLCTTAGCSGTPDPDEAGPDVARWAFSKGGTVRLHDPGRVFGPGDALPESFAVQRVVVNSLAPTGDPVRDRDLERLAGLSSLEGVELAGSAVGDRGAETLAAIESLEELELSRTLLTDAGVDSLARLPNLKKLFLYGTEGRVTADRLDRFRSERPDVTVYR